MVHILSDTNSILTVFSAYLRAIIPISMDRKAPGGTTQKKEVEKSTSFFVLISMLICRCRQP